MNDIVLPTLAKEGEMYWVIYHKEGVAMLRAESRQEVEIWCTAHPETIATPYAVVQADRADLEEFQISASRSSIRSYSSAGL